MKYSLRSLMILMGLLAGPVATGMIAAGAVIMSVAFLLDGLHAQPFQAVASSLIMLGIAAVIFLVARFTWREAWRIFTEIQNEPPSWGKPPPLPNSQAPATNPPKV